MSQQQRTEQQQSEVSAQTAATLGKAPEPDVAAPNADNEALQLALAEIAAEQQHGTSSPDDPDDDELLSLLSPTQHTPDVLEHAPPPDPDESERAASDDTAPLDDSHLQLLDQSLLAHYRTAAPVPEPPRPRETAPLEDTDRLPQLAQPHPQQGLAMAVLRDIGRQRRENQDHAFGMLASLPREGADLPFGLFVVADGMGGHEAGGLASRMAVHAVVEAVLTQFMLPVIEDNTSTVLQTLMIDAVQTANTVIWDYAQATGTDMGTTCTAALLVGRALYIAHVGDSRAYLLDQDVLHQLTTDHSMVARLIQMGQIRPEQAHTHPQRNQLYRAIGQQPDVVVDFVYQPLGMASHLLLCSDGLWGMLSNAQIANIIGSARWPHESCDELITQANLAGGDDNISAVVVTFPVAERTHS